MDDGLIHQGVHEHAGAGSAVAYARDPAAHNNRLARFLGPDGPRRNRLHRRWSLHPHFALLDKPTVAPVNSATPPRLSPWLILKKETNQRRFARGLAFHFWHFVASGLQQATSMLA